MDMYQTAINSLFQQSEFPADAFFATRVFDGRRLIIYGAGEGFHWVEEILMRHYGYQPVAILDRHDCHCPWQR